VPDSYIPVCLSLGYIVVYKVRMKKIRIAQRVKDILMAIGIRKSHSICKGELLSQILRACSYDEGPFEILHRSRNYMLTDESIGHRFIVLTN
jgi:hypothetical protein